MPQKIGRNDRCPCGSMKKYKVCCLPKRDIEKRKEDDKLTDGHGSTTEVAAIAVDYLKEEFPQYKVIDISNYLDDTTYKAFQTANYYDKVIMVAERNEKNSRVFVERVPANREDNADIIVMYHGAYRCFNFDNLEMAISDIETMITKQ